MRDSWILTEMPCMAHTPGPWRVHSEVPNRIILNGSACYEVERTTSESALCNHADMRLIAAAPDLLAALMRMRDEFNSYADCPSKCDAVRMAFQAIEKAGGE
jgi:hypothetical protein